jgi:hypothetical protein
MTGDTFPFINCQLRPLLQHHQGVPYDRPSHHDDHSGCAFCDTEYRPADRRFRAVDSLLQAKSRITNGIAGDKAIISTIKALCPECRR